MHKGDKKQLGYCASLQIEQSRVELWLGPCVLFMMGTGKLIGGSPVMD